MWARCERRFNHLRHTPQTRLMTGSEIDGSRGFKSSPLRQPVRCFRIPSMVFVGDRRPEQDEDSIAGRLHDITSGFSQADYPML
jgi:hypothetical protein